MSKQTSRRNFIQKFTTSVVGAAMVPEVLRAAGNGPAERIESLKRLRQLSANDTIQIGLIGAGGMGLADANTALKDTDGNPLKPAGTLVCPYWLSPHATTVPSLLSATL